MVRTLIIAPYIELWTNILGRIGACLAPPLVVAMVYEIISRQFFNSPTFWAFELAYMMMGSIFLFGIAYALKKQAHVSVDLIYKDLGIRAQGMVMLIGYFLLVPCVAWMTHELFWYMIQAYMSEEKTGRSAWNPVVWPIRLVYFIGFLTFFLQLIAECEKAIYAIVTKVEAER